MPRHYGKYPPTILKRVRWYREVDKRKGYANDLTIEAFMEHIYGKPCHRCGSDEGENIGADRLDNSVGHTVANVLPCCAPCNNRAGFSYATERRRQLKRQREQQACLQYDRQQASLQCGLEGVQAGLQYGMAPPRAIPICIGLTVGGHAYL